MRRSSTAVKLADRAGAPAGNAWHGSAFDPDRGTETMSVDELPGDADAPEVAAVRRHLGAEFDPQAIRPQAQRSSRTRFRTGIGREVERAQALNPLTA